MLDFCLFFGSIQSPFLMKLVAQIASIQQSDSYRQHCYASPFIKLSPKGKYLQQCSNCGIHFLTIRIGITQEVQTKSLVIIVLLQYQRMHTHYLKKFRKTEKFKENEIIYHLLTIKLQLSFQCISFLRFFLCT